MKKTIYFTFAICCLLTGINFAQWQPDFRLTNNSANSKTNENNAWCVAANGTVVHVIWRDERDGNWEIYYKRSTDGGLSWGTDIRLTNNTANSFNPSLSVTGLFVHVVWKDERDGNREIYYKRSSNGGLSWGTDSRLTNNPGFSSNPYVAVSGSVVHVVWEDERDGNPEIYYKRNPTGNPVGVKNFSSETPKEFGLSQNYPNPFNPSTTIEFSLPKSSFTKLVIYDVAGREIHTLVNEQLNTGTYEVDFDAANYPSGIYFYTLTTKDYTNTKRMVLIK